MEHSTPDALDKEILKEFTRDSRQSYREIARKLKVSTATVMNRVNNLQQKNIIQKYTAKIDTKQLGFDVKVIISVQVSKGKLLQVENKIAKHPNVIAVYDTTGDFDIVIVAEFKNTKSMDNFLKLIQTYDFVERTNTRLVLHTMKEDQVDIV
jgi:DNA-binding Lrp family transcriptional regulator